MEVSSAKFLSHLASVIPMIADAKFVVIDLEMSGINPPSAPRLAKPTMEEVYHRAREATKTFRMLQFGLTCIMQDETDGVKMASHNYHVSPMFNESWDKGAESLARMVDRTLSISYDTLLFLKKNCLRIEDVYSDGINYLGRAEEAAILPGFLTLQTGQGRDSVDLENADAETKAFYESVRDKIKRWEDSKDSVRGLRPCPCSAIAIYVLF